MNKKQGRSLCTRRDCCEDLLQKQGRRWFPLYAEGLLYLYAVFCENKAVPSVRGGIAARMETYGLNSKGSLCTRRDCCSLHYSALDLMRFPLYAEGLLPERIDQTDVHQFPLYAEGLLSKIICPRFKTDVPSVRGGIAVLYIVPLWRY